jgi:hypothetical protein
MICEADSNRDGQDKDILDFGFEISDFKSQLSFLSFAFILSIPVNFFLTAS